MAAGDFLSPRARAAAERLAADLHRVFAERLRTVVAYEPAGAAAGDRETVHTMALVDALALPDLDALLTVVPAWHKTGLATPLILARDEFERTLDVFPIEYGAILSRHVVVHGAWPFAGAAVRDEDLRHACERQIKGHLIHLREAYLETHGRPAMLADLVRASIPAFRAALDNIARLAGIASLDDAGALGEVGVDAGAVRQVLGFERGGTSIAAAEIMPRYLETVERLWRLVDGWGAAR